MSFFFVGVSLFVLGATLGGRISLWIWGVDKVARIGNLERSTRYCMVVSWLLQLLPVTLMVAIDVGNPVGIALQLVALLMLVWLDVLSLLTAHCEYQETTRLLGEQPEQATAQLAFANRMKLAFNDQLVCDAFVHLNPDGRDAARDKADLQRLVKQSQQHAAMLADAKYYKKETETAIDPIDDTDPSGENMSASMPPLVASRAPVSEVMA